MSIVLGVALLSGRTARIAAEHETWPEHTKGFPSHNNMATEDISLPLVCSAKDCTIHELKQLAQKDKVV